MSSEWTVRYLGWLLYIGAVYGVIKYGCHMVTDKWIEKKKKKNFVLYAINSTKINLNLNFQKSMLHLNPNPQPNISGKVFNVYVVYS